MWQTILPITKRMQTSWLQSREQLPCDKIYACCTESLIMTFAQKGVFKIPPLSSVKQNLQILNIYFLDYWATLIVGPLNWQSSLSSFSAVLWLLLIQSCIKDRKPHSFQRPCEDFLVNTHYFVSTLTSLGHYKGCWYKYSVCDKLCCAKNV